MVIHQYLSGQLSLCNSALQRIEDLRSALSMLEIHQDSGSGGISKRLISALQGYLLTGGWQSSWPIDKTVSHDGYASFFIDYQLDEELADCRHFHRYFLQFMFDNRQAIGTNLLKFEIASRNSVINGRIPICIAVCAEEGKIRKMGWDGAAASSQEYLSAISGPYSAVLSNPPVILSIESLENLR